MLLRIGHIHVALTIQYASLTSLIALIYHLLHWQEGKLGKAVPRTSGNEFLIKYILRFNVIFRLRQPSGKGCFRTQRSLPGEPQNPKEV